MDCMNSAGVTFNPLEYYEFDSLTLTQFISHLRDWKGTDGDVRTTREGKSMQQLVLPARCQRTSLQLVRGCDRHLEVVFQTLLKLQKHM